MSTINLNLYNRFHPGEPPAPSNNRLLANEFGGSPAQFVSPANAGDTLAIQLFLFGDSSGVYPFRCDRYAGISTLVRLRAQGNNHIYATSAPGTEIVPVTGFTVTRQSTGSVPANTYEVHRVRVTDLPITGTYRLHWDEETYADGGIGPIGTTAPIPINATEAQIQAAIRALPIWNYNEGEPEPGGGWFDRLVVTGQLPDFIITYSVGMPSHRGIHPLVEVQSSDVRWAFGWSLAVPLTDGDFTDLFLNTNAPAYAEVLINGDITAQFLLTASIEAGQPPTAEFNSSATNAAPGAEISFFDLSTNAPTSWAWDFGDPSSGGANTSTARNPAHVYAAAGTYTVQLTATNANGADSETKADYITIVVGGGGGPGVPQNLAGVHFDGNFDAWEPIEDVRISRRISIEPTALVYRQRGVQARVHFQNAPLLRGLANCPHDIAAIAVDETESEDIGGYICITERVWARVPNMRTERGAANKTLKQMKVQATNGVADLNTATVISRTASVQADYEYRYYNSLTQAVPALPETPDIAVVKVGNYIWAEAYGGFNPNVYGGIPNGGGDNFARVFISGDTRPYLGHIVEQLKIYG